MIGMAGSAGANESGFYAAFDGGFASYGGVMRLDGAARELHKNATDSKDFGWSFAVGYHFNSYVALEAGFVDLGQATTMLKGITTVPQLGLQDVDVFGKLTASARGKTLSLLAHAPTGNWDPFLKIGVMRAIVDRGVDAQIFVPDGISGTVMRSARENMQLIFGAGVRYAYTEQWAVSLTVDYYPRITENVFGTNGNVFSPRLGFAYRF
jgi:hypothetical protein